MNKKVKKAIAEKTAKEPQTIPVKFIKELALKCQKSWGTEPKYSNELF